ncbi:uncharacterized protein LOC144445216 [Glandiceps talaboti]
MANLVGTWKLEKKEGAEEITKVLEAKEDTAQLFIGMTPTMEVSKTDNTFTFKLKISDTITLEYIIIVGEEFEITNHITGEKGKATAKLDGDKLVITPVADSPKAMTTSEEVVDGKLVITLTTKSGVTCKQVYGKA